MKKLTFIFFSLLLLSACQNSSSQTDQPEQMPCTMEARLCPDGSSVGRTGSQCEFAECPDETISEASINDDSLTKNWKIVSDEKTGITFKYPESLLLNYAHLLTNPEFLPTVKMIEDKDFSCEEKVDDQGFLTHLKTIGGQTYCLKIEGDAAAGSSYNTYHYSTFLKEINRPITLNFTLRQVNCGNYDDPQKTECVKEQNDFNPDHLAVAIFNTVKF